MKDSMTNEKLSGLCSNNFDLIGIAISIAKEKIAAGKPAVLSEVIDELKKRLTEKQHIS